MKNRIFCGILMAEALLCLTLGGAANTLLAITAAVLWFISIFSFTVDACDRSDLRTGLADLIFKTVYLVLAFTELDAENNFLLFEILALALIDLLFVRNSIRELKDPYEKYVKKLIKGRKMLAAAAGAPMGDSREMELFRVREIRSRLGNVISCLLFYLIYLIAGSSLDSSMPVKLVFAILCGAVAHEGLKLLYLTMDITWLHQKSIFLITGAGWLLSCLFSVLGESLFPGNAAILSALGNVMYFGAYLSAMTVISVYETVQNIRIYQYEHQDAEDT